MSAPTDRTRGTAGDLTEREAFEKSRAFYTPFTRVYVTRASDGTELLVFGDVTGTAIHDDALGEKVGITERYPPIEVTERREQ
jgi:hypothetical protein